MTELQHEEEGKEYNRFDLLVTHRDPKTGLVTHTNPYILHVVGEERMRVWERPAGSGNCWDKHNKPVGRWVKGKDGKGSFVRGEAHIDFIPPETQDQKAKRILGEKETKIAELERELAQIRAEATVKAAAQTKSTKGS